MPEAGVGREKAMGLMTDVHQMLEESCLMLSVVVRSSPCKSRLGAILAYACVDARKERGDMLQSAPMFLMPDS